MCYGNVCHCGRSTPSINNRRFHGYCGLSHAAGWILPQVSAHRCGNGPKLQFHCPCAPARSGNLCGRRCYCSPGPIGQEQHRIAHCRHRAAYRPSYDIVDIPELLRGPKYMRELHQTRRGTEILAFNRPARRWSPFNSVPQFGSGTEHPSAVGKYLGL